MKLRNVQEVLLDKSRETIQTMFEQFVKEYDHDTAPIFRNKLIFYCLLKTEGDIMIELRDYHRAIQAYKALRNYCKLWGLLEQEMWVAEQIGMAYRTMRSHEIAIDYFKIQMSLAWELNDTATEVRSYDNLSQEYYYVGNIDKAKLYHERVFGGKIEAGDSMARTSNKLSNQYNRKFKDPIVKTHQAGRKGLDAPDVGRKPNYGESRHYENDASGDPIEKDRKDGKLLAEREESVDRRGNEEAKMSQP